MILIPFGVVISLAVLGFLWYLWTSENNETWQNIMINSWVTRTVSLSSLFLRTAATLQAGACTSMMAAVGLENGMFVPSKATAV